MTNLDLFSFIQLKPNQVLTIDHFKTTLLMMTKGKGVDVVINCMSEDATASSIGCLGFDSYFIHMSKCDLRSREIVGRLENVISVLYFMVLRPSENFTVKYLTNQIISGLP